MSYYEDKERAKARGECCGTCEWHQHENISDGWVCVNGDSDYCTDWTDYGFWCEQYEKKERARK